MRSLPKYSVRMRAIAAITAFSFLTLTANVGIAQAPNPKTDQRIAPVCIWVVEKVCEAVIVYIVVKVCDKVYDEKTKETKEICMDKQVPKETTECKTIKVCKKAPSN